MTTTAKIGAFFVAVLVALGILILKIEDIHFGKKARTNIGRRALQGRRRARRQVRRPHRRRA